MGQDIFKIQDLKIDFTTPRGILKAVRGISFTVHKGKISGIVGESGSGKSVTALSLLRLLPGNGTITHGQILFRDKSILSYNKRELQKFRGNDVSIIFQEPGRSFDPIYSIGKSFAETIKAHHPKATKSGILLRSIDLLTEVKIPDPEERLHNFPHQFSGGMLQRIMIAIALVSDPCVLIADEPTTSLDVTIQARIIDLLLELKEKRNLAIIFISHDLALIGSIADRLIVMYNGLVLEDGPADRVLGHPLHPYSRALLDSHPRLGDHYTEKRLITIPGSIPDPHMTEPGCPFAPRCRMVINECRTSIPPLEQSNDHSGHFYRCIFPGEKN
ncbi:MAG: ABC transporter ATP-binding protein [Spirochaetales bacterium]|nr:ABC transporter ATP-binding protein [Spirochaetales bacterium]